MSDRWMSEALREASKGLGNTSPNPAVGAVIVKHGRIIARGYHRAFGRPHAEVEALAQVRDKPPAFLRRATMVVTLEPCDHFGKTPPCTRAILRSGLRHVVVGALDPHGIVAGRGVRRLRNAGVRVDVLNDPMVREFYEPYRTYHDQRRSFVTLKLAVSTDGKIAGGPSRWITGRAARAEVQKLRRRVDAILIGRRTAVIDNPQLTIRPPHARGRLRMPLRIVLSRSRRLPRGLRLLTDDLAPTWVTPGPVQTVVRRLAGRGIVHLMVEGGAAAADSFLKQQRVDEIILFVSPKLIGRRGLDAFPERIRPNRAARPWRLVAQKKFGADLMLRFRPAALGH